MINKLRAELEPLTDAFQDAGALGVDKLRKLPFGGVQWTHRAYQRDPFIVAFHDALPAEFGTFNRVESSFGQKRLVFHSEALDLDIAFRRRGSTSAYRSPRPEVDPADTLYPDLRPLTQPGRASRRAALIWDVPETNAKHEMTGPMLVAAKLARVGTCLDDNDWEGGFLLTPRVEDLIPGTTTYNQDDPDWDVDTDEAPGAQ